MLGSRTRVSAMLACLAAGLVAGCSGGADKFKPASIEIDRPSVYPEEKGAKTALAVMRIKNKGGSADRLLRATSKRSGPILIQRTIVVEGSPIQRTVQGVDIPAGGSVQFNTNGYTLKLERVNEELKDGGAFPVILEFMIAGSFPVDFEMKASGPSLPKPAPKDASGNPVATGAPVSIQALEQGKYGSAPGGTRPPASGTGSSASTSSTGGSAGSGTATSH